jgi:hypothetical protein
MGQRRYSISISMATAGRLRLYLDGADGGGVTCSGLTQRLIDRFLDAAGIRAVEDSDGRAIVEARRNQRRAKKRAGPQHDGGGIFSF